MLIKMHIKFLGLQGIVVICTVDIFLVWLIAATCDFEARLKKCKQGFALGAKRQAKEEKKSDGPPSLQNRVVDRSF